MAQLDMSQIGKGIQNPTKTEQLKTVEPANTGQQSAELINNASQTSENTNEIKQDTPNEAENTDKVIVRYTGGGVWKDCEGKLWASEDKTENILSERQYSKDEYEKREDIKFMVQYGSMKATNV